MKKLIRKILFEPLFQFLIVGMLLFIYFDYFLEQSSDNLRSINISNNDIRELSLLNISKNNSFLFDLLVQEKYYESIMLEEALINKLHIQDKNIRNKLITQMQFLVDGEIIEPSEEMIKEYYEKNKEDYSRKTMISFYSLPLDRLDENEKKHIHKLLLQSDTKIFNDNLGYHEINVTKIEEKYGKYFTLKLLAQKKGTWSQALNSKTGIYAIYVKEYKIGEPYSFDEVIDRVYNDYKKENLFKKRQLFLKTMKQKYILEVLDD